MRKYLLYVCSAAALVSGCNSTSEADTKTDDAVGEESSEPAPTTDEDMATEEDTSSGENDGSESDPSAKAAASGITSTYTSDNAAKCETIEQELDEGSYVKQRCPGVGGVPLYVAEGDLRIFVHAGNEPANPQTIAPFNSIGGKVEWRLKDGKPFALIYRLRSDDQSVAKGSMLFVQKIGQGTAPSCYVAKVNGAYPNANAKARELADAVADTSCSGIRTQTFGTVL